MMRVLKASMKFANRMLLAGCLLAGYGPVALAQPVKQGAGAYQAAPKGRDPTAPAAPHRTPAMLAQAAPTNQWYSALIFAPEPEVLFAHPLTVKAGSAGFEFSLPSKEVVPTERRDVEIHYPHKDPLVISPVAFEPERAKLAKANDWTIDIAMARGQDQLVATVGHGNPYVYFQISRGDLRLRLPVAAERMPASDARVLTLRVKGKTYALFGPSGVGWERVSPTEWIARLPAGKGYLSAAPLPDDKPETLALFTRHAYAFVQDTRVAWQFDAAASRVETTFKAVTRTMEGEDNGPLLGLYPHQWHNNPAVAQLLGPTYESLRGPIRLLAAREFKTGSTYNGFVPYWPALAGSPRIAELTDLMKTDKRNARRMMLELGKGSYWQGKGLQRITKLLDVVEQQGDLEGRDQLLKLLKTRIESWFSGSDSKTYFAYDKGLGTVLAYPEEYFSIEQMNDHHFHYGYWIRAMADIALRDPAWASKAQWGGMVDLLIADIATAERGRADFPFLRNFDPYEGHSWASGIGLGPYGNNQESSSEAINAWAGLIMWGEITGNQALRELGLYLYTTEIQAINYYWFDIHQLVFPPEYKNVETSMLFGSKYAHNTWWIDEPRQIKGINLLPITTSSTYLGRDPDYVKRSLATLKPETAVFNSRGKRADPPDIWQDIFAKYMGLADPALGLQQWDRWGSFELGDTRSHALHWLLSLNDMGPPDLGVTANTTFYSVFRRSDGRKTYLAYNAGKAPLSVRFSDGKTLQVAPATLAQSN
jgi:endoglucanase Acf2